MKVFIVIKRGEELPDSAYASEDNAAARANQLGAPTEAVVWPLDVKE